MGIILKRIEEIAAYEGITIGALERRLGASKGVLSRAITQNTDIQSKWLIALVENYPRISTEWLLRGSGNMLINPAEPLLESGGGKETIQLLLDRIEELSKEVGRLEGVNKKSINTMDAEGAICADAVG